MANCTINDRLFAVKPIVFSPSVSLAPKDIFLQELSVLQTLSRLGLALMFADCPSLAFLDELQQPGYWQVLNRHTESLLKILDAYPSNITELFSDMVFQLLGQMQSVLTQGLEKLYPELSDSSVQLWYNYLFVLWNGVNKLLQLKGSAFMH